MILGCVIKRVTSAVRIGKMFVVTRRNSKTQVASEVISYTLNYRLSSGYVSSLRIVSTAVKYLFCLPMLDPENHGERVTTKPSSRIAMLNIM